VEAVKGCRGEPEVYRIASTVDQSQHNYEVEEVKVESEARVRRDVIGGMTYVCSRSELVIGRESDTREDSPASA
jgi:hypothetical protein